MKKSIFILFVLIGVTYVYSAYDAQKRNTIKTLEQRVADIEEYIYADDIGGEKYWHQRKKPKKT